jgi:hypothetical protein
MRSRHSSYDSLLRYYFLELFGIAVVCLVLEAQYNPAPKPMPVITDSAITADPDTAIPNNDRNILILLSNPQ